MMRIWETSDILTVWIVSSTCFKNPENLTCIYLILTNKPLYFQSTCVIETGLSDFHRVTVSVLKTYFCKLPPKVVTCKDFKRFENETLMDSLKLTLNNKDIDYTENMQLFLELCRIELEDSCSKKKKGTSLGMINRRSWLTCCLNLL